MKVLLDTHAVIWWFNGNSSLSDLARATIGNEDNEILVSSVSAMEITTKHRLGKLPEAQGLATAFEAMLEDQRFTPLDLKIGHGLLAGRMAVAHKDPFDRLLMAQSLIENAPLVSNEKPFDALGVKRLW